MKESPSRKIFYRTWRILRGGLIAAGAVAVIAIILAFTTAPFWTWYGIGSKKAGINRQPDYIVLLGGGGMPSESGLMRSWYTARVASYFSHSTIIIALPGIEKDTSSSVNLVKKELILRGISPGRIVLESAGTNTRAQALNIIERISNIECRMSNIDRKK